jgi:hypothetical protein
LKKKLASTFRKEAKTMEYASSIPSESPHTLKTVRGLARYAVFAQMEADSAGFRSLAPELGGPVECRKIESIGDSLVTLQQTWIHLGIRNKHALVVAIGSHSDLLSMSSPGALAGLLSPYGIIPAILSLPRPIVAADPTAKETLRADGQYVRIFEQLRYPLYYRVSQLLRSESVHGGADLSIEVCGYGVAGAVATLCALWFATWSTYPVTCVTLGSPKVGDCGFVHHFESYKIRCYRVLMPDDAWTPPLDQPMWAHVGKGIRLFDPEAAHSTSGFVNRFVTDFLHLYFRLVTGNLERTLLFSYCLAKFIQLVFVAMSDLFCDPSVYLTAAQRGMEDVMGFKTEQDSKVIDGRTVSTIWLKEPEQMGELGVVRPGK